MGLLKKENWLVCLILTFLTQGVFIFVLGYFLKVYDKNAWYAKWYYWLIGCLLCFMPIIFMLTIFTIQISIEVSKKLEVPGSNIYSLPYTWILCLIVPIIGWSLFIIMELYITIWPSIMIKQGKGEI